MEIKNQQLKTSAILTIAFLIDEENSHLIHMDSKCGVMKFVLEKLENTLYTPDSRSGGFSTLELLKCIYRVAMNDANKIILVYDGILTTLSALMKSNKEEEKELTAKVIWSLAFVEDNRHVIMNEQELVDTLRQIAEGSNSKLSLNCQGALFELEKTQDRINRALERQCQSPARAAGRQARGW